MGLNKLITPTMARMLAEENDWPEDWLDHNDTHDWGAEDRYPWSWYMECDIRLREDWALIEINPDYKNITVINWLRENNATFKYYENAFLIQEQELATIAALKWA